MTAFTSGCTTSGLKRWPFQTNLGSAYKKSQNALYWWNSLVNECQYVQNWHRTRPWLKNLFEFEGNGLNFKLKHRKVYIQFYLWDLVTRSGDWGIRAVPGRLSDNRGELAHMLSHNRLIIIYDVGMCSYHMMKLMKMVSTLQYHTNSNGSLFSFGWCNN